MSPEKTALLIEVVAGMLAGLGRVAVGASSPIPGAAALLARERGGGRPEVSLLGSQAGSDMTDGGRELFDRAGQGRIDAFFLGGVQIDGGANINLVGTGPHPHGRASAFPAPTAPPTSISWCPGSSCSASSTRPERLYARWISSAHPARAHRGSTGGADPTRW